MDGVGGGKGGGITGCAGPSASAARMADSKKSTVMVRLCKAVTACDTEAICSPTARATSLPPSMNITL